MLEHVESSPLERLAGCRAALRAYVRPHVREQDVDDVVQQVFADAIPKLHRFDPSRSLLLWLHGFARVALQALARRQDRPDARATEVDASFPTRESGPEEALDVKESRGDWISAFRPGRSRRPRRRPDASSVTLSPP